jgi:hypothetical protein
VLHRPHPDGIIVITQPAHAWLSGQIARAWGNRRFGTFEPHEDVCLAAEQHDLGWLQWERAPTLNPSTGYPHTFLEVALSKHLPMWNAAGPCALAYGRYVALLVSMHGSRLYARRDNPQDSEQDKRGIREYLRKAHRFEKTLQGELRQDPYYKKFSNALNVSRNQRLVALWDYMSLLICMGLGRPHTLPGTPLAGGSMPLELRSLNDDMTRIAINPWPFKTQSLRVWCEGRLLSGRSKTQTALTANLAQVPWVRLEFTLLNGER